MAKVKDNGFFKRLVNLYGDGFRGMTWGRPLWILILLKLFILFAILRLFFFRPVLAGKTDAQKSEYVGTQLTRPVQKTDTDLNYTD